ncbi:hypothetical protein GC102_37055 [Paenibacillus sp. LMG 31460]|uniref:(Fe-S)-binding protein n=1 Tax=Paenibacillus germinis TaxID=2654979 RepID=A0ABX1ZH95_9BACL|nr:hypothetical protein [Paenibacillus germinis]
MIHHYYPKLFDHDPVILAKANRLVEKTYEFTQFLVQVLGVSDLGAMFPHKVTYHPSCHGSRLLGVKEEPKLLMQYVRDMDLVPLPHAEDCCGFGGTFAVKMCDISGAMVSEKSDHVLEMEAEVLVGLDMGCLMNIAGNLSYRGILAGYVRRKLREKFLEADIGMTGCNFAIAETGSIVLFENEGNARMVSTIPKTQITFMGMERIIPSLDDLEVMATLLPRSATGAPALTLVRCIVIFEVMLTVVCIADP